jgi:hypothetical protein
VEAEVMTDDDSLRDYCRRAHHHRGYTRTGSGGRNDLGRGERLAEGRRRADRRIVVLYLIPAVVVAALSGFVLFDERFRRWDLARAVWIVLLLAMLPASLFVWLLGGYWLCGTDTTEPAFGDRACNAVTHPLALWLAIITSPLAILLFGGLIAFRRKNWRLFAASMLAPPMLIVVVVAVTAIFPG